MIKLGKITLSGPLILAPIAGFTDSPFRRIALRHGAGLVVTELISAEGIVRSNRKTLDMLTFHNEERPIAIQIFGNRPDLMAEAATVLEELKPDLIDINLGCPARRICASGSGAALLSDPGKIYEITSAMVKRVRLPITAKIRIGQEHNSINYRDTVRALEEGGVSLIFVHGRTRAQQYGGFADWDAIREIAAASTVPIIGNGDICTHAGALERMAYSGCPAVMIGRGAIGNPWIFSGIRPSPDDVIAGIKEHLDLMIEHYGDRGIVLMRKHFVRYIHEFMGAKQIRKQLVTVESREEIHKILNEIIQQSEYSRLL
jgi:tRNA-dihydrouridine synthase B